MSLHFVSGSLRKFGSLVKVRVGLSALDFCFAIFVSFIVLTSALVGRSLRLGGLLKPNKRSVFVDKVEVRTFIQKFPVV